MLITSRDKPIGRAKGSALYFMPEGEVAEREKVAAQYGIHPKSIYQWQKRHPECNWSFERIAQQIVANKDQSQVAKRQGFTVRNGRNSFGRMTG